MGRRARKSESGRGGCCRNNNKPWLASLSKENAVRPSSKGGVAVRGFVDAVVDPAAPPSGSHSKFVSFPDPPTIVCPCRTHLPTTAPHKKIARAPRKKKPLTEVCRSQQWKRIELMRTELLTMRDDLDKLVDVELAKCLRDRIDDTLRMSPDENFLFALELDLTDTQYELLHNFNQTFHDVTCSLSTLKKARNTAKAKVVETFKFSFDEATAWPKLTCACC